MIANTEETGKETFNHVEETCQAVPEPINFGKITSLTTQLQRKQDQFEVYQQWIDGEKIRLRKFQDYVCEIAEMFSRAEYAETKTKTWSLPNSVKLQLRKRAESLEIQDEQQVILWAREHAPETLITTISKTRLHAYIKLTGVIPDGTILLNDQPLSFSLSLQKKGKYHE